MTLPPPGPAEPEGNGEPDRSKRGNRVGRMGRIGQRVGLPLLGGGLIGLSLPPLGGWLLGLLGVALVARALGEQRARARFLTGLLAGVGQFFVALAWALQFNTAGYVVLAIVESLFIAVACLLVPPRRGLLPGLAGAFVLAEWARQRWPFGGLPLGGMALGQVGGPLAYSARIGGGLLVVGVSVLAGASLAVLAASLVGLLRREDRRWDRRRAAGGLAGLVVACAFSFVGLLGPDGTTGGPQRLLTAAIVQGGGKRGLSQLQVPASDVFEAALRATEQLHQRVDLILWPEDVVAMSGPFNGSKAERVLAGVARIHHATLMVGVTVPVGATKFRNEIVAFSPEGRIVDVFEKVHRVPFGEYVPWRGFFRHFANLRDVPRDAIPGHGSGLMTTPAGRFAVLVSYEVFFAGRARSGVRAGGQVILVPTNTSSYSNDQAPAQEIAASRLQALQQGRYVLQAAPTGYSAVIDNGGNVLDRTALSSQALIHAIIPKLDGSTWYVQLGDLPVLIAALVAIASGWAAELGRRRRKSD